MNSQEEIRSRVRDAQARALDVQAGFAEDARADGAGKCRHT